MSLLNKHKRLLQERSHLTLEFPQSGDRVFRTFIPFLENPTINERGQANLNTYDLVGRAGQLFSYAGAQSRKLNVTFFISFPHLIEMDAEEGITDKFRRQFNLFFTDKQRAEATFKLRKESIQRDDRLRSGGGLGALDLITTELETFDILGADDISGDPVGGSITSDVDLGSGRPHASIHRAYYRGVAGLSNVEDDIDSGTSLSSRISAGSEASGEDRQSDNNKHLDLIYCWLNLIRASVMNRSDNTVYGPPIVRLTHGSMYGNVPCLLQDYSIKVVEDAGYEAETLTPKRIEVTLNLLESRTGDFGEYAAGQVISGDNLTGWESVVGSNEMDPHNGLISREGKDYAVL
tara:strand:+ start:3103 stop:4149 length:1047 start_codon:yes stop_codon:yes gene_type:complete